MRTAVDLERQVRAYQRWPGSGSGHACGQAGSCCRGGRRASDPAAARRLLGDKTRGSSGDRPRSSAAGAGAAARKESDPAPRRSSAGRPVRPRPAVDLELGPSQALNRRGQASRSGGAMAARSCISSRQPDVCDPCRRGPQFEERLGEVPPRHWSVPATARRRAASYMGPGDEAGPPRSSGSEPPRTCGDSVPTESRAIWAPNLVAAAHDAYGEVRTRSCRCRPGVSPLARRGRALNMRGTASVPVNSFASSEEVLASS